MQLRHLLSMPWHLGRCTDFGVPGCWCRHVSPASTARALSRAEAICSLPRLPRLLCLLQAGSYALRVQSASRKVAVADAVVHLAMQPLNAVIDLRLVLPEMLASGECVAGTAAQLNVEVLTENGLPLPPEVAAGSLVVKVMPPGECFWQ